MLLLNAAKQNYAVAQNCFENVVVSSPCFIFVLIFYSIVRVQLIIFHFMCIYVHFVNFDLLRINLLMCLVVYFLV